MTATDRPVVNTKTLFAEEGAKYYVAKSQEERELAEDLRLRIADINSNPRKYATSKAHVDWQVFFYQEMIDRLLESAESYLKKSRWLKPDSKALAHHSGVTDEEIARARSYPIPDIIKFNRAKKALCPYHHEDTPSFHYYPKTNTTYCFSCSKSADAIDLYQHTNSVDFITAVKQLNN